jgi:hypothetical protein
MGVDARGVKPSLDGAPVCSCPCGMNVRLPLTLLLATSALLALEGCGPKRRPDYGFSRGGGEEPSATPRKNLDRYDEQVSLVRQAFPKEQHGSAVVARFYNPSKNMKLSLVYVDKSAPEFKPKSRSHLVLAEAKNNGELLSTMSILHTNWQPGTYSCGNETLIGFALSDKWNPAAPDTYGSWNAGAGCEFELHPSPLVPGDLEGTFRGVFVQNDGGGKLTIQDGYLYVKSFQSAPM